MRRCAALRLGGHDPRKVYAAYKAAVEHQGWTDGDSGAHDQGLWTWAKRAKGRTSRTSRRKLNEEELREFRSRFGIPLNDEQIAWKCRSTGRRKTASRCSICARDARRWAAMCRSASVRSKPLTLATRRTVQGILRRQRRARSFDDHGVRRHASQDAEAIRRSASWSCRSCRTKRARLAWSRCSERSEFIRASGQKYEPVDVNTLLYYKEAKDGQILEEGITEAGSMASFIAAGSAYATHGINTIPFFIYYSMFGFQRIGDFIWAAADMRTVGSCWAELRGARRLPAKDCSTRTATATCWRCRSQSEGLRSCVCVRNRRDYPGRHSPDVQGRRESFSTTSR